jgi:hypothetical protein
VVSGLYTFHNKIARRLESGLNPIYYLSKPSDDLFNKDHWIHVLQAYDVSEIRNSSFTIKFWDINSNREYGMKKIVEVYFERDEKGIGRISANYNGSRLSGIFELNNDKQDITSFISNDANFDFCDKYKINGVSICYDSIDNYSK